METLEDFQIALIADFEVIEAARLQHKREAPQRKAAKEARKVVIAAKARFKVALPLHREQWLASGHEGDWKKFMCKLLKINPATLRRWLPSEAKSSYDTASNRANAEVRDMDRNDNNPPDPIQLAGLDLALHILESDPREMELSPKALSAKYGAPSHDTFWVAQERLKERYATSEKLTAFYKDRMSNLANGGGITLTKDELRMIKAAVKPDPMVPPPLEFRERAWAIVTQAERR